MFHSLLSTLRDVDGWTCIGARCAGRELRARRRRARTQLRRGMSSLANIEMIFQWCYVSSIPIVVLTPDVTLDHQYILSARARIDACVKALLRPSRSFCPSLRPPLRSPHCPAPPGLSIYMRSCSQTRRMTTAPSLDRRRPDATRTSELGWAAPAHWPAGAVEGQPG